MTSDVWQPVERVGKPTFIAGAGYRIKVELKTRGWLSRDWRGYFGSQIARQRLDARLASFDFDDIQCIEGSCEHEDAERYIELIDAAIHYANTKFEGESLPRMVARSHRQPRVADPVRQRQAALDNLAQKLAKPDN